MVRVALYQPEIAGNCGTILRTCACFRVGVDIIEPCGFAFSDRALARAGMDYIDRASYARHPDWSRFLNTVRDGARRLVLLTTQADRAHSDHGFADTDVLLFGSESAGVPDSVHGEADARVTIPMAPGARSLNLAVAAGIATAEALRQIGGPR